MFQVRVVAVKIDQLTNNSWMMNQIIREANLRIMEKLKQFKAKISFLATHNRDLKIKTVELLTLKVSVCNILWTIRCLILNNRDDKLFQE